MPEAHAVLSRETVADPVVVALDDPATAAALIMWNRGFKTLPVVAEFGSGRLVGCIRTETVMHAVMERIAATAQRRFDPPRPSDHPTPTAARGVAEATFT